MIISVEELQEMTEFKDVSGNILKRKLLAIEDLIREYTNNNFQNRKIRFTAPCADGKICGVCEFLKVGNTIQITESEINSGLFVITEIDGDLISVDGDLYDCENNLVTKVEYPAAIADGVINLLIWDKNNRNKVGIQSETLSRHSVTYFNQDASNQLMGYPITLFGFLKPYIKARF